MLSAVVITDQLDYAPGSTAHITARNDSSPGTDFQQGETVQFQVHRTDGQPDFPNGNLPWQVTDGVGGFTPYFDSSLDSTGMWVYPDEDGQANGSIETTWLVEQQYAGASLQMSAHGLTSGATATQDFTDGNVKAFINSTASGDSYVLTSYRYDSTGTQQGGATTDNIGSNGNGTLVSGSSATYVRMEAAINSSKGLVFDHWTKSGVAGVFATDRSIFVTDFASSTTTYTAFYVAAQGKPQVTTPVNNLVANEGASTSFNLGSFIDADGGPWSVLVDWGDGTTSTFNMSTAGTFPAQSHTYADNGAYTGSVTVTDSTSRSGANVFIASVANVAPTGGFVNNGPVSANSPVTVSFNSPTDPSSVDLTAGLHYSFATTSGGLTGTYAAAGTSTSAQFTFATNGTYTVFGRVFDKDGGFTDYTTSVVVNANATALAVSPPTGTYGGTTTLSATLTKSGGVALSGKTVNFSLNGTSVGSAVTDVNGIATLSNASLAGINAGSYAGGVTASFATDGTNAAASGSAALTVNKATVTPTVTVNNKVYDRTTAATINTETLSGVLGADNVTLTGGTATFADWNVGTGKTVTISGLTLSGTAAGNYQLSSTTATATANITAKALTGSFTASNKVYDGTQAASVSDTSLPGVIAGDTVNLSVGSASFADKNVGTGKTVTGTGLTLSGPDAGNYTVNSTSTTTANITALALTGSFTAANKVYDRTTAATVSGGSLPGVLGNDSVTLLVASAAFADRNVGTGKTVNASLSLSGGDAGNYTVNSTATTTANITALALTGSVTAANKVYDGTKAASVTGSSLPGVISGDTVNLVVGTALFSDENVANGKTVTAGLSLSGPDAGNYTVNPSATTTANVTPATLTAVVTAANKVYDDTQAATITGRSLLGVIGGDVVSLIGGPGSFADKNVGTAKTVTVTGLSLTGAGAGNYVLASTTATTSANISALAITGSITAPNKTYDGSNAATISGRSLSGVIAGDDVGYVGGTATFSDANAGTGKTLTATGLSLSGGDAGNYTVNTTATTTADIARRAITVTANSLSKTYGNADPALTYSLTGGSLVAGDSITGALSRATGEDVGSYAITQGSLTAGSNYDQGFVSGSLTINKATLHISVGNFSRTYGDANPSFTGSYTGAKNGEIFTVTGTTTATAASNVGTYAITAHVTGATLANYDVVTDDGVLTITAAHLTVSANGASKTYGDAFSAFGGSVTGIKNGDNITAGYSSAGSAAAANAGSYAISAALNDPDGKLGNYIVDSDMSNVGTLAVDKAALTVTAGNASRVYGDTNPSFSGSIVGIKNGDAITALYGTLATAGSDVGGYAITATLNDPTGKLSNYDVTLNTGTLTITKAVLTVTADDKTREYGDPNPTFTASVSGFKNGENLGSSGVTGAASLASGATATSNVGDYAIIAAAGSLSAGNYSVTFVPGTLSVTKATLDIFGPSVTRVYGHADPSLAGTFSGAKNGETFTISGTTPATATSAVGNYLITPSASGSTLANYDVVAHAGNLAVSAAELDIYVADASRIYGDANPTFVTFYTGQENGETFTVTATTSAAATSNVGTYTITPSASGLTLGNYIVHTHTGSLDVTLATLTISADDKSRTYGGANPSFTGGYTGEKNGETFALSFTTGATVRTSVGDYAIVPQVSGSTLSNYTVVVDDGTLTIGKAHLVVTANDKTKVYGQANPTLDGTITGIVAGDDIAATYTTTATQLSNVTAGGFGITPHLVDPDGRLGNYDVETNDGTLAITKANQTITWSDPAGITYGAALSGTQLNAVITGVAGGSPTGTVTYTPGAGTVLDAGQNQALTVSVAGTSNYNPATLTVHIDVAKAAPTITLAAPNAVYDAQSHGVTTASIAGVNGDVLSLTFVQYYSGTTLLSGAPTNAGTYKVVASFAGDSNYQAASEEQTFTIAKADQTISWAKPGVITYGTAISGTQLDATVAGVPGGTTPGALSYDVSAGDVLHAGAHTLTVGAAATANYNAASAQVTLTVAKAAPVIDLTAPSGAVYNGSAHPATATITGVNGDTLTLGAVTYYAGSAATGTPLAGAPTDAGTYTVVASFGGNTDYLPQSEQATFTVAKKSLTISVNSSTKTYGDANPTFSIGYSGFVAGEDQDDLGGALSFGTSATQSSNVGHYTVSASGLTSGNYDITYVDGDLKITRKALTVTVNNATKVYGQANPDFTASYNGFVLGQNSSVLGGTLTFTPAATAASNVGSYSVTPGGLTSGNYDITFIAGTLNVTKAALTVSVNNSSKVYGSSNPSFSVSYSGFANGDNADDLGGALGFATSATQSSDVGHYVVSASGLTSGNYDISYEDGDIEVTKKSLEVSVNDVETTYGTAPSLSVSYSGFVLGQDNGALGGTLAFSGAGINAGTYTISASGLTSGNYDISYQTGTLTVHKAALTVTTDAKIKTYGDTFGAFTGSISGLRYSDGITAAYGSAGASATATVNGGPYNITASLVDPDGKLSNYDVTYVVGKLTVNKAALSVTPADLSRVYGSANPALTGGIAGIKNGDAITASYSTTATAASHVGSYDITASLNDPTGKLSNYEVTLNTGTITVTKAALTIAADNKAMTYGGIRPALTATYTGLVNGDTAAAISGLVLATAPGTSHAGTYTITASGATSGDYGITLVDGTLTIDKGALTITADNKSMTYGGTQPALTASYAGLVNGDTPADINGLVLSTVPANSHAGTHVITATGATSGDYEITLVEGTLTINKAALTVTADDKSMTYGGTLPALTASYAGLVNGDTASDISGLVLATVPASSHAGSHAITASGATAGDYDITFQAGTLTIHKAALTVTADHKSMTYGGTLPALTASYSGLVNGDSSAAIANLHLATVPATSHAGAYAIVASGATSGDYDITLVNGTLTINKAALTITADDKTMTYGGTLPTLTASYTGLVNGDTAGDITGLVLATVPADSHAGTYAITASGATSGDYDVTLVGGTLTINKAALTITANDKLMTYGGTLPTLTASFSGLVNGDTAADIGGLHLSTVSGASHAGTYDIVASGATSGDYNITLVNGTLTIDKAALTITANDKTMTYGGSQPALTASYSGLVNGDTAGDMGGLVLSTVPADSHAGSYVISATGATSGDYAITLVNGTLTIDKAPLTITAEDKTMTYGSTRPGLTFHYTGLVNGDTGVDVLPILSTVPGSSHVGSYAITGAGAEDGDYDITYVAGTLTITRAALTVTVDDSSKTYGDANPAFSVSYSGFVNGDDKNDLGGSLAFSIAATAASHVGNYDVSASGLTSGDYNITFLKGNLQISKAHLGVEVNDSQRTYGDPNPTFDVTYTGFVNGDDAGDLGGTLHFTIAAGATSNVGTYAVSTDGLTSGDYDIFYADGTLTINKAQLDIYAASTSRTYGDANPTFGASYSGQKNGEAFTVTGTTSANAGSSVGTYLITPGVTGATLGNYDVVVHTGTLTINKATLVVTPGDFSRIYGSANPAFAGSIVGIKNGDAIAASYATTATAASHVGSYDITASLNDPTGKLGNYDVTLHTGALTITKAALTISADNQTMVYGGTMPTLTYHYTGLVNGDAATDVLPTLSTVASSSHVDSYDITIGGASDGDYDTTFLKGTLTITKAALTITANNKSMTYGGTQPALSASYAGLVNGDTAANITGLVLSTVPANSHAGSYVISASGATSGDYNITLVNGTLTIKKAALTITADNKSMTYGGTLPALTTSYSGLVNGDSSAAIANLHLATVPATSHAGAYAIVASGATSGDYDITLVNGTLTINKAALTITADDKTMTYGGIKPALTASYNGLVNGDTAASIGGLVLSTVQANSHAGSYVITASGATSGDYDITLVNGTMTIDKAALVITADNKSMTYGGTMPGLTLHYTGLANGDTTTDVLASLSTVPANSHAGSYAITASGASDADYDITYVGGTLTVNKAALTITADNKSMTYGGIQPGLTASYGGLVNGDTAGSISDLSLSTVPANSHAGSYVITAGGATSGDYNITLVNGTLTINKAALTITADDKTMTYGGTLPTLTYHYTGLVNGDAATDVLASLSTVPASSHVGSYDITASGATDADYNITFVKGTLKITRAALTITADGKTRVYGQGNPVLTASYSGFVNGDSAASLTTAVSFNTVAGVSSPVGSYAITAGGATSGDYDITFVGGTLSVTQASTTTGTVAVSGTYWGPNATLTATVKAVAPSLAVVNEGTVTFAIKQGSTVVATVSGVAVVNGTATATGVGGLSLAGIAVGSYTIEATYVPVSSSPNFTGSLGTNTLTIAKAATTTAVQAVTTTYGGTAGDPSGWNVLLTANVSSNSPSSAVVNEGTVAFTVKRGTTIMGTFTGSVVNGVGTANATFNSAWYAGGYTIDASYVPATTAPNFLASTAGTSASLTIAARAGLTAYIGATSFITSSPSTTTTQVVLTASVVDQTGNSIAHSVAANTFATFWYIDPNTLQKVVVASNVPVKLVNNSDTSVGTATTTVTLSAGQYGLMSYQMHVDITGSYVSNNDQQFDPARIGTTTVTVYTPSVKNTIRGRGDLLVDSGTAGTYAGEASYVLALNYTNGKSYNPQGNVVVTIRKADSDGVIHTYVIKTNSLTSLTFGTQATPTSPKQATLYAKASIYEVITNANGTTSNISIDGNVTIRVDMTDGGNGVADTIGFTILSKNSELYYSNNWVYSSAVGGWNTVAEKQTSTDWDGVSNDLAVLIG